MAGIDQPIPNIGTPWEGYKYSRVEEFIKRGLQSLQEATDGKVGWMTYENGNVVFYDEEGGTQLGIVSLSGTVYAITLTSTTASTFYVLKDDTVANINVTPTTKSGTMGGEMTPFIEDYRWSLSVDNGSGMFVEKTSGDCLSGGTILVNVRNYLAVGANRVKVTVTGKDSGQTKTTTFTANVTSLTLTSRYSWNNPWLEGEDYAINGLYFSGNLQKTLYVRVDDDDEQTYTQVFSSGTNYISTPFEFDMSDKFPGTTGIHTVEIWIAGDGVETPHYLYNVMCVEESDINQVSLVCLNEIASEAVNFETQRLFRYATYNATSVDITIVAHDGQEEIVIADGETIAVQTQTKTDYTIALEVETETTQGLTLDIEVEVPDMTAEHTMPINNANSYAAVDGAVFYLNAANRSNGSADREEIINSAPGASTASYDADWTNMSWSTDGWFQDSDSNRALVIKAGSTVLVDDLTPLARSSVGSVSIEWKFRCSNISDYDTPIFSLMSTSTYNAATTNGIVLFPTRLVVLSSTDRQMTPQTVQLSEDKILHVVVVLQRGYKQTGRNLCRIYVNGVQQCVFEYDGTGSFGSGPLRLGQTSADLYLYTMRVYNKVLEADAVLQNFLNSIIDGMDYTRSGVRHDNNIMDGGVISYDLCKAAGFNTMVVQMAGDLDIPSLTHSTGGLSTVWLEYADHPTWNVQITNAPISGQGTTSMRYYRWNLRNKLKKSSAVWHYADGTTDNVSGYIAGKGLHPKVNDIVAKKNVASSMQGHKMGACNMFDELYKAVGIGGLPSEDVRVSIYQYPMLGFQKYSDGTYVFIGLYTVGPAKNDAGTRGYDTTNFPSLLSIEGPNHAPLGTRFLHPWIDVTYDYTNETLCFGGEEGWDVGACAYSSDKAEDAANILALFTAEWKPAYNIAYLCSPYLVSLAEAGFQSLAALNADKDNFRAGRGLYGNKKNDVLTLYDSSYNLIYYRNSTGQYEVLADLEDFDANYDVVTTHDIKAYLGSYLTAITSSSSPTTAQLRAARMAKFKAEGSRYWSINAACFLEAFLELIACSDNHAKNTYPMKWKPFAEGGRWIWCLDDPDTCFMTDNNGQQTKSPSVEVGDVTQDGVDIYQGSSSSFWEIINSAEGYQSGVKDLLSQIVNAMVTLAGQYNVSGANIHESVQNMIKYYFWDHSAYYFPLSAYNADADWTYVDVWELDPTATYNSVPPLRQANGTQLEAERKWVEWHIVSLFSKYGIAAFTGAGDDGMGRLEFTPAASFNLAIKPAVEMYPTGNRGGSVGGGGVDVRGTRTPAGTACIITASSDGTTAFYLKGVDWYTDLGDLSGLTLTSRGGDASTGSAMAIAGKRLQRVKVGDAVAANVSFNADMLNISGECIEDVDCRNVTTLRNAVSLANCPRLKTAKFAGSTAPNIVLPIGCKVSEVSFPESVTTLALHTLPMLDDEHITLSATAKASVTGMYVNNCAEISIFDLLRSILNTANNSLHFVSLIWEGSINMTGAEMELLAQLAVAYDPDNNTGFGRVTYNPETGLFSNTYEHALLQGTINVTTPMYEDTANTLRAYFGNTLVINCSTYYIRFEDPEVMRICAVNWGDHHTEYQPNQSTTGGYDIVATSNPGAGHYDLVDGTYVQNKSVTGDWDITETANTGAGHYDKVEVGEGITPAQAAAVSSLGTVFQSRSNITTFNELNYFTKITRPDRVGMFWYSSILNITIPTFWTSLGDNTFQGCTRLEDIVVPANIMTMGGSVFRQITTLRTVTFLRTTPPTIGGQVFLNSTNNLKIYVPADSVSAYKAASNWSSYASYIYAIPQ